MSEAMTLRAVASALLLGIPLSSVQASDHGSKPVKAAKLRFEAAASTNTRVIGGRATTIERNPWQVALVYAPDSNSERAQFCGGVIVHPQWVLTAAHCVDERTSSDQVELVSGTAKLSSGAAARIGSADIIVHRDWDPATKDFDIALVRAKAPLRGKPIEPARDPVALAKASKVWVSGWGVTDKLRPKTMEHLQGISLDVIPIKTCNGWRSYGGRVTGNMFCAGIAGKDGGGGKDSCQGDSGGPASVGPVASAQLVGVVSWGVDCALAYKYGVYTRVSNFLGWVRENTKGEVAW